MVNCGAGNIVKDTCPYRSGMSKCTKVNCEFQIVSPLIGDRTLVQRNPDSDRERIQGFSEAMFQKWQKGRAEHGTTMKIDPFDEACNECVDLGNYAMEIYYRIKKLKQEVIAWQKDGK